MSCPLPPCCTLCPALCVLASHPLSCIPALRPHITPATSCPTYNIFTLHPLHLSTYLHHTPCIPMSHPASFCIPMSCPLGPHVTPPAFFCTPCAPLCSQVHPLHFCVLHVLWLYNVIRLDCNIFMIWNLKKTSETKIKTWGSEIKKKHNKSKIS